ncbi:MAG: sulfite exporter TauE/SafE family protein [Spirochaetes bacterium]|nr:sulfite exporter TauE/SafE family protein [Spirochaetota bacterium]
MLNDVLINLPETSEVLFLAGLFFSGMTASFVNILAGGGSLLVLGFMMLCGIEPSVANATNRIGVLIACTSGAAAYKSEKFTDLKQSFKLSFWALPGAVAGAFFSVSIGNELFEKLIALVMIFILATMFVPQKKQQEKSAEWGGIFLYPAMIAVGFYGGFIQVGVGFLIAAALRHFGNMSLMKMNMHKLFVVLIFTVPVIIVFLFSGKINWIYAAVLSCGNALGSWLTVKLALKKGEIVVKTGMVIAIVLMVIRFF